MAEEEHSEPTCADDSKLISLNGNSLHEVMLDRDDARNDLSEKVLELATMARLLEVAQSHIQDSAVKAVQTELADRAKIVEQTSLLAFSAADLAKKTAELLHSNEMLSNRTAELETSNRDLKALLEQRKEFVAGLSHDLKNPLIGSNRVLEHVSKKCSDEEQIALLQMVIGSNQSMLRMIWNMLDSYRYEAGALMITSEKVNISELVHECLNEFAFDISNSELQVKLSAPEAFPLIDGDQILLKRVLTNLLDNAIKYTPEGGTVEAFSSYNETAVMVSISDSGKGLSFLERQTLFNQFCQGVQSKYSGVGTGLGLYFCKRIIEEMSGTIECTSSGEGTTFTIKLPIACQPEPIMNVD